MIKFQVSGNPKALKRHRMGNGFSYDPSKQDKQDFLLLAHQNRPEEPLKGPLTLACVFYFQRPKSHYGTGKNAGVLKNNAPKYHIFTPDTDNLIKFVADALGGVFYVDDSQLCQIYAVKMYSGRPRTVINIYPA